MRTLVTIVCLVFMVNGLSFAESPITERPVYTEGDEWIFITRGGKQFKTVFVREENNTYVFSKKKNIFSDEGTEIVSDFELSRIENKKHRGHPGPILKFPLEVGKKWKYKFETTGSVKFKKVVEYKVEEYEEIKVTAGTFPAFKISLTTEAFDPPPGAIIQTHVRYLWYAPEVKVIIKKSGEKGKDFYELKEYKVQ